MFIVVKVTVKVTWVAPTICEDVGPIIVLVILLGVKFVIDVFR